jgi:hypothetical protein
MHGGVSRFFLAAPRTRRGLSPSPRPLGRRSAMAVEVSVGCVRWVGVWARVWARAWEGRAARGAEWDGMGGTTVTCAVCVRECVRVRPRTWHVPRDVRESVRLGV